MARKKKVSKKKAAKKRAPKKVYAVKAAVEQPQIQTAQNFILAKRQYRDDQAKIFQKRFPRK